MYSTALGNQEPSKKKIKRPGESIGQPEAVDRDVKSYQYDMSGHAQQCIDKYLELTQTNESSLMKAGTPSFPGNPDFTEDEGQEGQLSKVAASIVMKLLWLARMNRPDILFAVNMLARSITKWTKACDRKTFRLICYLNSTKDFVQ